MSSPQQMPEPQLADKVRALRDRASYPTAREDIEAIETHFAWVFLTNQYAFKLKKPVQVNRIDYRQLDARRRSCLEEVKLNRRLAADVYLDVVALASDAEGRLRVEGRGTPVEWLVKMRRLPEALLLDRAIKAHTVTQSSVRKVAALLAAFYCEQSPVEMSADEYIERLERQVDEHRAALLAEDIRTRPDLVDAVVSRQREFIRERRELVAERAHRRKIIEAHGDLKPEHVYVGDPPCIIDRLEFDRDLRLLDPLDELAFLSMECERAGALWVGKEMIGIYLAASGDACEPALFDFYSSHRAAHRAVIAAWHLRDAEVRGRKDWKGLAETYLTLAWEYLSRASIVRD